MLRNEWIPVTLEVRGENWRRLVLDRWFMIKKLKPSILQEEMQPANNLLFGPKSDKKRKRKRKYNFSGTTPASLRLLSSE